MMELATVENQEVTVKVVQGHGEAPSKKGRVYKPIPTIRLPDTLSVLFAGNHMRVQLGGRNPFLTSSLR